MLKHGFDMHNVFPFRSRRSGEERDTCRGAISESNENEAMPSKILLVSVGLPSAALIVEYRAAVAENIRRSACFVPIFEDDRGPTASRCSKPALAACTPVITPPAKLPILRLLYERSVQFHRFGAGVAGHFAGKFRSYRADWGGSVHHCQ